jgi:trypsin-like peptidase
METTFLKSSYRLEGVGLNYVAAAAIAFVCLFAPMPGSCEPPSDRPDGNAGGFGLCDQLHEVPAVVNLCRDAVRLEAFGSPEISIGGGYQGSGTLVSDRGHILTAGHIVTGANAPADRVVVNVQFANGAHRRARLVKQDEKSGLAVLRIVDGETLPQPYFPLKFGERNDSWFLSRTIAFAYASHAATPRPVTGQLGDPVPFYVIGERMLKSTTPNIDRRLDAERVFMESRHGMSGSAVALKDSGDIVGITQFARTELPPSMVPDPNVLDQSLLTPYENVVSLLRSLGL